MVMPRAPQVRSLTLMPRVMWALGVAGVFFSSLYLASSVLAGAGGNFQVTASLVLLVALITALIVLGAVAREIWHWRTPSRALCKLVNEIRAGQAPLSELDVVQGGLHPLAEAVRAVLLDLRDQKRTNAELKEEMRQRVQNRTDALERQLGVLKAKAMRDSLTGLGNRAAFDAMMPQSWLQAWEGQEDLSVLMIDVDNFKLLNDTLGHAAGDEMLRKIGEVIRSSVRDYDSAYRIGGDEFVVVLPRCPNGRSARRPAQGATQAPPFHRRRRPLGQKTARPRRAAQARRRPPLRHQAKPHRSRPPGGINTPRQPP
jgi:GGDEF domain-containing protein